MFNKEVVRRTAAAGLIICLILATALGAAAGDGTAKKGFMLPGMGALYDGSEEIRGGVEQLLDGNQEILGGLVLIGQGLDSQIAGNLDNIKAGIDSKIVPGLDSILAGITGQVVPGLRDMKKGVDDRIVPGLDQIVTGINQDVIGGLDQMRAGMTGDLSAGLTQLKGSLQEAGGFVGDLNQFILGSPDDLKFDFRTQQAVVPKFGRIKGYMLGFENYSEMTNPTSLYYDIALYGAMALLPANIFDGGVIELPVLGASGVEGFAIAPIGHLGDGKVIAPGMVVTGPDPTKWIPIRDAVSYHVAVKQGFIEGALAKTASGIGGDATAGIDQLQGGVNKLVGGIDALKAGLRGKLVPGLTQIRAGLAGDMSKGLGDMLTGFNKTEQTHGESGIVEGLTLLRGGLSNRTGDPGVSDGLGMVSSGIRGDIMGGMNSLKEAVGGKVVPGLQDMNAGIQDQLQPGFAKVSMLLLVIWLVSLVIVLLVGYFIGRAKKAKVSSGHGASM